MGNYGVIKEKFETKRDDGKVIRGLIFRPDTDEKCPVAVFSHGFGSNYRELMHHGEGFADIGIACLFYDFCGGGMLSESDGTMQEMTILTEVKDLETVAKAALELPFVNKEALFLIGESQGGIVSAYAAKEIKNKVKAMVLWYPAFVIPDDSRKRFKEGKPDVFGIKLSPEFDKIAMEIDVEEIQESFDKPVLIIHGDKDPVVPLRYSESAIRKYPCAKLEIIKGAGHGYDGKDSVLAREMTLDFIRNNL